MDSKANHLNRVVTRQTIYAERNRKQLQCCSNATSRIEAEGCGNSQIFAYFAFKFIN